MNYLLFIAGAFGFAPALVILWLALRDYSYPKMEKQLFSDNRVFGLIAAGMVVGTVLYIIEGSMTPYYVFTDDAGDRVWVPDMAIILYVLLFSMAEEAAKLMILLFPALRKNFDNVFYGVALGCGMSAVMVLELTFVSIGQSGEVPTPLEFTALALYSTAFAMLHASTGAIIAEGSYKGLPWPAFVKAFGLRVVVALLMLPAIATGVLWFSTPFILIVCYFVFRDVHKNLIPRALPDDVRAQVRGRRRRE
jgi:hypothetical protein